MRCSSKSTSFHNDTGGRLGELTSYTEIACRAAIRICGRLQLAWVRPECAALPADRADGCRGAERERSDGRGGADHDSYTLDHCYSRAGVEGPKTEPDAGRHFA